jgi:hypothetical protein
MRTILFAGTSNMPFWKVLIGGALTAATPASAADWRYCLASALDEHKVYMSEPFQTDAPMTIVADAFSRRLDRDRLRHGEIQCPRSDSEIASPSFADRDDTGPGSAIGPPARDPLSL